MAKRLAIFAGFSIALILAGPPISRVLFPFLFLVGLIPNFVIFLLTVILAPLAILTFRHSKLMMIALAILFLSQAMVLSAWMMGLTANSWFLKFSREPGALIIDPSVEKYLMATFWITAGLAFAAAIEQIIHSFRANEPRFRSHRKLIAVLLAEIFLLSLIQFGAVSFVGLPDRSETSVISPNGSREIQLRPMSAWFDINGIVIQRENKSIWWRSVARVGDILTDSKSARFVWQDHDSKVFLLLNVADREYPAVGFDFNTHQNLDPRNSYQPANY